MGLFTRSMPASALSSGFAGEYGDPTVTFDHPSSTAIDEVVHPVGPGEFGSPISAPDASSGDVFQRSAFQPEYAGAYDLAFRSDQGLIPSYAETNPAPGSESLLAPRNAGEVSGTNTIIQSTGPVGGEGDANWSGLRDDAYGQEYGLYGPVAGGPDYHSQLQQAYWQANNATVDYAAAEAGMVASV